MKTPDEILKNSKPLPERIHSNDIKVFSEKKFAHEIQKHTRAKLHSQYKVDKYRLDFVLELNGRMIGVEIDGRDFHTDWEKDSERDQYIIENSKIESIVRYWAKDTHYNISFCVQFLLDNFEWLFDKNRYQNLKNLLESKIQNDGLFEAQNLEIYDSHRYQVHPFKVQIMKSENIDKYEQDDVSSMSNTGEPVNPLDYCFPYEIQIRVKT